MENEHGIARCKRVRHPLTVANTLGADEDIDVDAQATQLIAQVETDAGREWFERAYRFGHRAGLDTHFALTQLGKEGEQVAGELDGDHARVNSHVVAVIARRRARR